MQLAAITDEMGFKINVLDNNAFRLPLDAVREEIKGHYDVIGIGALSTQYKHVKQVLPVMREEHPDALIVGGGGFITAQPFDMMRWLPDLGIGCIGESYITWREVLENVETQNWKKIRGLVYRDGKKVKLSKYRPLIPEEELDDNIPWPAYEFSPVEIYLQNSAMPYAAELMHGPNYMPRRLDVLTAHGCPWRCTFCLPEGTLVLTYNLKWIPIQNMRVGDSIIGVVKKNQKRTKLAKSTVTHLFTRSAKIYIIETENGTVKSSAEHPWLTDHGRWRKAADLKVGQVLRFISEPMKTPRNTQEYMKGYIVGAWKGDGTLAKYHYKNRNTPVYRTRLAGDYEMLDTALAYAQKIGLEVYKMKLYPNKIYKAERAIGSSTKHIYYLLSALYTECENPNPEFIRGFLAGIYDAEGSWVAQGQLRICNKDINLLHLTEKFLNFFGFQCSTGKNNLLIKGGYSEAIRFMSLVCPSVTHKKQGFIDKQICHNSKILNITIDDKEQIVYNLETSTGNFIADGFVTHNCFHNGNTAYCQSKIYGKKITGKEFRQHSPEYVVKLIQHLRMTYLINFVSFMDENMTVNSKWFNRFCDLLEETGLAVLIHWGMVCHSRTVNAQLLQRAKDVGLCYISYGGESASEKLLKQMKKGQTPTVMTAAIQATQAAGINPIMSFVIGFPNTTLDDLITDCQYYIDNRIRVNPFFLAPYPGSELYQIYKEKIIQQHLTDEERAFLIEPTPERLLDVYGHDKPKPTKTLLAKRLPVLKQKIKDTALERWVLSLTDATKLSVNLTDFNDVELAGLRYMMNAWEIERLKKFKKEKEANKEVWQWTDYHGNKREIAVPCKEERNQ